MKKQYSNKQTTSKNAKKQDNLYTFPKYNLTVNASSLLEAQKKLGVLLKEKEADK